MIFCKSLLYLHVPKTGGMSVTDLLLRVCPRPTFHTHPAAEPRWGLDGVHEIDGLRHETLAEAKDIVQSFGLQLQGFPVILSMVRNPYEMEVSRFAFYQQAKELESGNKGYSHALAGDFRSFALTAEPHGGQKRSIERFFLLDGVRPPNLRVARYEHLAPDLQAVLEEADISTTGAEVPHHNASSHLPWRTYYDADSEAAVFSRYRWLFEAGYYQRLEAPAPEAG